ncbi:hypothetical protein [Yoonia sp.]|uniref:hypothetical protein n=1 Tax=Yoonia sp. TaxID=2212373 RepID=UPI0025FB1CAC|nr:hypothetical protein [Yoonia sp.]
MTLCPCDHTDPLRLTPIAPGLSRLPRQIGDFGRFRADLLARVRRHPALSQWRARDAEDFGLMLLESWAYVCDVTAFYTGEHAQDLYLQTARSDQALRRLVALIDHIPRPAVATEAILAAILDGSDPVTAPARAGFLSDAIDDTPPQVFEASVDTALDPLRNSWTLLPKRDTTYRAGTLLIAPASRNMAEGGLIVVDPTVGTRTVVRVASLTTQAALDGVNYLRLKVDDPGKLPSAALQVSDVRLWSFTQTAPVATASGTALQLNGHYPLLRTGALVVLEDTRLDGAVAPQVHMVINTTLGLGAPLTSGSGSTAVTISGPPVTNVTLAASTDMPASGARLHFGHVRAGQLAAPAKTVITGDDLLGGRPIAGAVQAPTLAGKGEVMVSGAADAGLRVPGDVDIDPDTGSATLHPGSGFAGDPLTMRTPVQVHGNLLHVTRGKTVEEVVGSGQGAGVPFQTFTLAKSPLTYVHDAAAPGGRRSTLRLWIDGIPWQEVRSLFTAGPRDRVFTVRLDAAGKATITTGGDGFGHPAPLGVQNVYALYRYGAGDPAPGAQQIRQMAGSVQGLRRVFNVTPAFGGAHADRPEDIRFNAPATAATFDRAISASDFAALAKYWGVHAAEAVTEWVPDALREGVVVTAVFDGTAAPEDIAKLTDHLVARAAEATPIRVVAAQKQTGALVLTYQRAPDFAPDKVQAALAAAFTDPFTGFLAPRRAAVGGPVFRSAILGHAGKVPGVGAMLSLTLNGVAMPIRLGLPPHGYFAPDFAAQEVTS